MNEHQKSTLWVGAFRYYLGRQTYAVGDFCDLLLAERDNLPAPVKHLILREIESAIDNDDAARERGDIVKPMGWDCDRRAWEKVKEALVVNA